MPERVSSALVARASAPSTAMSRERAKILKAWLLPCAYLLLPFHLAFKQEFHPRRKIGRDLQLPPVVRLPPITSRTLAGDVQITRRISRSKRIIGPLLDWQQAFCQTHLSSITNCRPAF